MTLNERHDYLYLSFDHFQEKTLMMEVLTFEFRLHSMQSSNDGLFY